MRHRIAMIMALSCGLGQAAIGAQELEPGVQTSSAAAPVQRGQAAPATTQAPRQKPGASPPGPTKASGPAVSGPAASGATAGGKSGDRIQLDTTQISGNRELPKVMYVVPWRRADPGDFAGRPPNSLLDEALTPVDRDVFRRQNRYYGVVQGQAQSSRSQAGTAGAAVETATPKDEK
jgi:hypothetical protein